MSPCVRGEYFWIPFSSHTYLLCFTKTYLDTVAGQCTHIMNNKWKDRLGGIDEFLFDNCNAMTRSLRVD
jgi:hypothetical protein